MKREHSIIVVSVLLLGILFLFGCQSKELTSAKVYIQQDDWEKAEEQLKIAVDLYPNDAEAHALLGEAYGRRGAYKLMTDELEASLAAGPQQSEKVNYLKDKYWVQNFNNGVNKVKSENFAEALDLFENCFTIDPNRVDAYKNAAFVHIRMQNLDKAIDNYKKAIEIDPKDTKIMLQLGSLYYDKKEYEKCIEVMDNVLAVEPGNIEALSQKAFSYDSMGETDKAFAEYGKALEQKPGDADLLFNLGRLYYMKKDYSNAIKQFEKVLETAPGDQEATLNIGNAYLSIAEEHMKPLREGNELTEDQIKEAKDKAVENYKEAIPWLEKAVEQKPDDSGLWTNLGVAYINAGMKEKGEAAFKKADEL
jgi:Flp pilus assembly protein TadD